MPSPFAVVERADVQLVDDRVLVPERIVARSASLDGLAVTALGSDVAASVGRDAAAEDVGAAGRCGSSST